MNRIEKAIVRTPATTFADGITPGIFGKADSALARKQHQSYIEALTRCGVEVIVLDADDEYPDSCFTEDPAIVTNRVAILTNFSAQSRRGETERIAPEIQKIYGYKIERISGSATVEGGDICRVEDHFFIGLSRRTNEEGACQLAAILKKYGFTSSIISIRAHPSVLHLKTCMSYLGDGTFVMNPVIQHDSELNRFKKIVVPENEIYASNCVRANDYVIMPQGYEKTAAQIKAAGFKLIETPMSEFMKQDGGLTCLSLRVPPID